MTSAPPEPKLPHKNPGVEKPDGFFVKKSCIIRKSVNPHFGALLKRPLENLLVVSAWVSRVQCDVSVFLNVCKSRLITRLFPRTLHWHYTPPDPGPAFHSWHCVPSAPPSNFSTAFSARSQPSPGNVHNVLPLLSQTFLSCVPSHIFRARNSSWNFCIKDADGWRDCKGPTFTLS